MSNLVLFHAFFPFIYQARQLTKEILHNSSVDRPGVYVTKDKNRSRNFTKREGFGGGSKGIVRVESFRNHLLCHLAHGQHVCVECLAAPVPLCNVEDGLIEDVVVAEESVSTRHGCVVFEDIVNI